MKFGPLPVREAVGALSAHTLRAGDVTIRKGKAITVEQTGALEALGVASLVVARLEPGDLHEDEAAHRLGRAFQGAHTRLEQPFTGRANLYAERDGILLLDAAVVTAVNRVDEAVTVATLPPFRPVRGGEMIATVKIIPYAVAGECLDRALVEAQRAPLAVAPYVRSRVAVISTLTSGLKASTVNKTLAVLAGRLNPAGAGVVAERRVPHESEALAAELVQQVRAAPDLIVVFGASAIADRRDVIPAAIVQAGGTVEHFGMPVDPGNLMLVGALAGIPVIGAPGCARSPKENGFDWVLHRMLADVPVTRSDITAMGVGGLLMETPLRGQPRAGGDASHGTDA